MEISIATQLASFVGAILILLGYVGHQVRWLDSGKPFYNLVNALGAGILAYIALRPLQVGFAIMEIVWVAVSLLALYRSLRPRRP
jgi:hypothetical protein